MLYSFIVSCLILLVLNFIPGLHLRVSEEDEIMGIDETEVGEFAVSPTCHFDSIVNHQTLIAAIV